MSSASAKIILLGEHAVVYGEPAIAIPVSDVRAYAEIEAEGDAFQIIARDLNDRVISFDGDDPLLEVVRLTLEIIQREVPPVSISIRSDIPIASGLGSGAAISTAIIRVLLDYFGVSLPTQAINEIVYEVEKIHHGTPSGIDNTVIVYEQPVFFVREKPIERIPTNTPLMVVIGDTGRTALTKIAVGDVRRLYDAEQQEIKPIIQAIGQLVHQARDYLENGDTLSLGQLMVKNHELLQQLTVSSDQLDHLVQVALNAGAFGAKLSGGGRGGNMIALVDPDTAVSVKQSLLDAGAVRVFTTTLEATR